MQHPDGTLKTGRKVSGGDKVGQMGWEENEVPVTERGDVKSSDRKQNSSVVAR